MNQRRYEKEIEEILKRAGDGPPEQPLPDPEERPRRRRLPAALRRVSIRSARLNYRAALLAGIILLVFAIIIETGALYLFLAGAALLVGGYVMYYRAPRSGGSGGGDSPAPQMWRGRTVDPDDAPHFTDDQWGRRR